MTAGEGRNGGRERRAIMFENMGEGNEWVMVIGKGKGRS